MFAELANRRVFRVLSGYAVVCFVVLQIADVVFVPLGISDDVLRSIIALMLVGFPVVGYLAWVFDMDADASIKRTRSKRPVLEALVALICCVVFALGAFWLTRTIPNADEVLAERISPNFSSSIPTDVVSLAVLPFRNLSDSSELNFLGEAIAEELINKFNRIPGVRVVASSSANVYRDRTITIDKMASQLGVNFVLDGTTQRSGDQIQIKTSLIDPWNNTSLWSSSFDGPYADAFGIQQALAESVADALKVTLQGDHKIRVNPQAYVLYLEARRLNDRSFSRRDIRRAERLLEDALDLEPEFISAWTELARVNFRRGNFERYVDFTAKALALDEAHPGALAFTAFVEYAFHGNFASAASTLEKAVRIDRHHYEVVLALENFFSRLGRYEVLIDIGETRLARDPLCVHCMERLIEYYHSVGNFTQARRLSERALLVNPDPGERFWAGQVFLNISENKFVAAKELLTKTPNVHKEAILAAIAHLEGDSKQFDRIVLRLEFEDDSNERIALASLLAFVGRDDEAFSILESEIDNQITLLKNATGMYDPGGVFANLRFQGWAGYQHDPRWQNLLEPHGLANHQAGALRLDSLNP